MKTKTPSITTPLFFSVLAVLTAGLPGFAADQTNDNLTLNQSLTVQGASTLNGNFTLKSDTDAGHINTLKITSGGYGGLWWQPVSWYSTNQSFGDYGRGVSFVTAAFRWDDFGFFTARQNHDTERPTYITGDARFYHDIDANVTVIGHSGPTDPRIGHSSTLNVEGSLKVDGALSCGSFSGPLTASSSTTYASLAPGAFRHDADARTGVAVAHP